MKNHPLQNIGIKISFFKSFGETGISIAQLYPINVIIGRNNSGKSSFLDGIKYCIDRKGYNLNALMHKNNSPKFEVFQILNQRHLEGVFPQGNISRLVHGLTDWEYGQQYVGKAIKTKYDSSLNYSLEGDKFFEGLPEVTGNKYDMKVRENLKWPFKDLIFKKVGAERDVASEEKDETIGINENGFGVTNLIRHFINSANLDRRHVREILRKDLNTIFEGDSFFTDILTQELEGGKWEVFLTEEEKGDIALSQSGSGLKTIIIILSILLLVSQLEKMAWDKVVLTIEEPENNLHPALLRRLLSYLSQKRDDLGFSLFITTHSPICIDWAAKRDDSQVIHVRHDGNRATGRSATDYVHNREILDDLDIRASDILQANGVIWVEGPTDRLFLRKWIEVVSDGHLKEGIHYNIMFYGGKLLSHLSCASPGEEGDLISLLSLNRNLAIMIDSDRKPGNDGKKPRMRINNTKRRIRDEVDRLEGFVWITEGKEVENYLPDDLLKELGASEILGPYHDVFSLEGLKQYKNKKIDFAHYAIASKYIENTDKLDLNLQLAKLQKYILSWNTN